MTKTKSNRKAIIYDDYKYNIDDVVINLGSLYEEYKHAECVVISRSRQKSVKWYDVKFKDGKLMNVKEAWIKSKEVIESEVIINEL